MMETPRRRIPDTSYLNEVSTDHREIGQLWGRRRTSLIGLGISDKNNSAEGGIVETNGILAVPQNRKLLDFCSEALRGRENYLEFHIMEQK
jgi:hypothetical protein